jgi:hypothetical protein
MRTYLFPLLALLITVGACAQPSHLDRAYQQFNGDGSLSFDPGIMLNISFTSKKISVLHCFIVDGKKTPDAGRRFRSHERAVREDQFEEWFSIRKGKGRVAAYSLEGPGGITDVVCLLIGDDDGGLYFHLRGHFTEEDKHKIELALKQGDRE